MNAGNYGSNLFPLIPLLIKEAILSGVIEDDRSKQKMFPLIPLLIKEAILLYS